MQPGKTNILAMLLIAAALLLGMGMGPAGAAGMRSSNVKYFYVFGSEGSPYFGASGTQQVLFVRVSTKEAAPLEIQLFDPDTGGGVDDPVGSWNTRTRFSLYGGKGALTEFEPGGEEQAKNIHSGQLLEELETAESDDFDKEWVTLGKYTMDRGERIGPYSYFRVVAEGLSGDDGNLFGIRVLGAEVEQFFFRGNVYLAQAKGERMHFYPELPEGTERLYQYNFNLGASEGIVQIFDGRRWHLAEGSEPAKWAHTLLEIQPTAEDGRLYYRMTKESDRRVNMSFFLKTYEGYPVPVYFVPEEPAPKSESILAELLSPKPEETPESAAPMEREQPKAAASVQKPAPGSAGPSPKTPPPTQAVSAGMPSKTQPKGPCDTFNFDATKSFDPDNQRLVFNWDFGDGQSEDKPKVEHRYAEPGFYTVTLTVADGTASSQATQRVFVNHPPKITARIPDVACVGNSVFFDATGTTDTQGQVLTYVWDFGDGEKAAGVSAEHLYKKGGVYAVTLTVQDDSHTICDTSTYTSKIRVNTAPVADAGKDVMIVASKPDEIFKVRFDAVASKDVDGDALSYYWDFGDGQTGQGRSVGHEYPRGGVYLVNLLVSDDSGTGCDSATDAVKVTLNHTPVAVAGLARTVAVGEPVEFDASQSSDPDGDSLTYRWDFGDGQSAEGQKAQHKYAKGGNYLATLWVDDGRGMDGSVVSATVSVKVNTPPSAVINAPLKGAVGMEVEFDASGSVDADGDRLQFAWDFGDGQTAEGRRVKHTYLKGGSYKVRLQVDDAQGLPGSVALAQMEISINTPPLANAGPDLSC
ncbi:MAG: PKD domain-containing protein, partial [Candidatus Omnitrophica bacterium]|nr:PKD domain-containing protein [Candidatus Omnitrophota bacterium]